MVKTKLSKDQFWDSVDPDKLNLTKKDIVAFCDSCIDEWKENKVGNFRYIVAMSIMKAQIQITQEVVLKKIWKKIINFHNEMCVFNKKIEKV